jgi:hypothetical protein
MADCDYATAVAASKVTKSEGDLLVELRGPGSGQWGARSGANRNFVGRAVLPQND